MPATSIFISAASGGISGMGNSRISVLLGPTRTAANTFSATITSSTFYLCECKVLAMRIQEHSFRKHGPEHLAAIDRVREWTRARFALAEDIAILVSEVACALPGCPPLETVIAFWEGGLRYHFKIFKPVA